MLKIDFTEKAIDEVCQQFIEHPSGLTKKKLHVVYLKALGVAHKKIERIARTNADNVTRYLKDYAEGGLATLGVSRSHGPVSSLQPYQHQIKSHFLKQPPHTVSEAAHEIEVLTGIKLGPSACRDFMRKRLAMKFRKMAVIPAKADPEMQAAFLSDRLEPLLEAEKQDKRKAFFFVDAAHFVMRAFWGMLWCFERLFLKSASGRRRYNVLGAFSVKGTDLITVNNDAYINTDTIVDLLIKIKQAHPYIPLTLVMDNARYQRCNQVTERAKALGIDILFLPPDSPNLNLIERLWKFTKKKCLYNRYHETFCHFKAAIDECLEKVKSAFSEQVKTLLNPKFQLFGKSAGVTA